MERANYTPAGLLPNKVLFVAGGLALVATVVAAVVPAFVGVWQVQYGIRADQAAFAAAIEFFAQVVGTGVFIVASQRCSWRRCATGALLVMILGNLASAVSPTVAALITARALAGLGGGALRGLGMTCLARAASPGLAFALYATAEVAIAATVTAVLPDTVAAVGGRAPFLGIAIMAGAALCTVPLLPPFTARSRWEWRKVTSLPAAASCSLAGLFLYFAGQGALWTFLEPIGKSLLIESSGISRALTLLNLAGLVGSFGVGALAHRVSPTMALSALMGISLLSIMALFNAHTSVAFIFSSCVFYFAWCASFPFQFAIIARSDASGTASAAVPAVNALGLASGAALAGTLMPRMGVNVTAWIWGGGSMIGVACFIIAACLAGNVRVPLMRALESTESR